MEESNQTRDLTPAPVIRWRAVQPRHYHDSQLLKEKKGREMYEGYVLSLVFRLDGQRIRERPSLKVVRQIVAAFEAEFRPKKVDGE